MSLPNTGSWVPVALAPRKPNNGNQSVVALKATKAEKMKAANHGALFGTAGNGRHSARRL
jgi:hypothetical protein